MEAKLTTIRSLIAEEVRRVLDRAPAQAEVMNADDVAAFLGVDRKTVYDYANRGAIPHQRLGKRLLFSRAALLQWLGAQPVGAQ
jgi:excisionase family DNA binding protein